MSGTPLIYNFKHVYTKNVDMMQKVDLYSYAR